MNLLNFLRIISKSVKRKCDVRCLNDWYNKPSSEVNKTDEEHIKSYTVVSTDHLTPEIKLHLITPKCEIWYSDGSKLNFLNDPFWAIYWPGGQALSRYILDNCEQFKGKNIVDIGSGSGACAIAAAKCSANIILANDIDALSLKAIKLNAELNNVELFLEKNDIIGKNIDSLKLKKNNNVLQPKWDIVLIGDMFYDPAFSNKLFKWLCYLNSAGKTIFIGDPGRYSMDDIMLSGKLIKVADYKATDEHFGFSSYSVDSDLKEFK